MYAASNGTKITIKHLKNLLNGNKRISNSARQPLEMLKMLTRNVKIRNRANRAPTPQNTP